MEKIKTTIIVVNIEIIVFQMFIENMMYLFSMSLPKTFCNWEL